MGVLRFALPRWLPPFRTDLEFIGHSGISGAIAFRHTASGRIIVGTVNQMHDRSRPYRMMIKAALA
jgi:D-alanyl-D-alanine carboxypeptidase